MASNTLKKIFRIYLLLLTGLPLYVHAQTLSGMSGLLNIPSADMQADGTFIVGGNYLPAVNQPTLGYNTGNYYLNLTLLPFFEVSYRATVLKMSNGYTNQDRSVSFKIQLLKEHQYLPAVTVGASDFLTHVAGGVAEYFEQNYFVLTKHFQIRQTDIGITTGYGTDLILKKSRFIGLFGGVAITPAFCKQLKIIGDFDCKGTNLGGSLLIIKHVYLFSMAEHLKYIAGGLAYRVYL